ncbi:MAG: MFS transporter [Clostridia bacterium]
MKRRIDLKNATAKEILAFSMIPLGMFFIGTTVGTVFNFYMTDVLKLSMGLVSIVLLGTKAWDAINDPIMGLIVEKTRTKWGKCRPYLLWIAIPLGIVTTLLFLPIEFSDKYNMYDKSGAFIGNGMNFAYVLLGYMVYITAYTAIEIPYNSLTPLVFPQKDKRVKAVSVASTLGSLGSILPQMLAFVFIGFLGNGHKDRTDWGYFWAALIFSAIGVSFLLISFSKVREKVYIAPRVMSSKKGLKTILTDKRVIILIICAFFSGCVGVGNLFLPYFSRWNCIRILPMDKINNFLAGIMGKNPELDAVAILPSLLSILSGISYMLSMLIIPFFLKKMSKKQLWIRMSFIGAGANVFTFIMGTYILPYNTVTGFIVYAVLRFFTNFPVGMSLVLIISMFADITDDLEMKTGDRLEATAYSMKGFVLKLSYAIFNVIILQIINALGYNADRMVIASNNIKTPLITSTTQASWIGGINYTNLLNGIFMMLTLVGAFGLICQAIPMIFLKFDEEDMEKRLVAYRKKKDEERQAELDALLALKNANETK